MHNARSHAPTLFLALLVFAAGLAAWPARSGAAPAASAAPVASSTAAAAAPTSEPKSAPLSGETPPPDTAPPAAPSAQPGPDASEPPHPAPPPRDRLKVFVLTFSPGDHPFYKFGHNAILIHDDGARDPRMRDRVYNYGMFSFGDPALIPKFFQGRFMYWMQADPLQPTIRAYQRENRGIEAQELDMPPAMKAELRRLLEENALEQNKFYKYDYYLDNCSTRVRDKIDEVTQGRVKAATQGPARLTYREQTLRLTADFVSENVILNLVMGDFIDQPINEWQEDFIPMELQQDLRRVTLLWDDGVERPLVKEETTIIPAVHPPPPANPPILWPYSLAVGAILGALLAFLGRVGVQSKGARIGLGLALSFFGLVFGFFGWFFLAAWAFTDHRVGYHNENVLLAVPWAIVLVGSGINIARSRAKSVVFAHKLVTAALGATAFDLVAKVLPWFDQKNGFFLVFFLPFWAGAFYGLRTLSQKFATPALELVAKPAGSAAKATAPAKSAPSKSAPKKKDDAAEEKPEAATADADDEGEKAESSTPKPKKKTSKEG